MLHIRIIGNLVNELMHQSIGIKIHSTPKSLINENNDDNNNDGRIMNFIKNILNEIQNNKYLNKIINLNKKYQNIFKSSSILFKFKKL